MNVARFASFLVVLCAGMVAWADDGSPPASVPISDGTNSTIEFTPAVGINRALILCGLTGDAEHRVLYAETVERLHAGLTTHHGFAAEQIAVIWGDEPVESDGPAIKSSRGVAARESIASATAELEKSIQLNDTLWVFVLGHVHYDGRYSYLNLKGPDMQHLEFGKLFTNVKCRQQAFFLTTSASGFFLKSLAAPGRIVVTATEPDFEVNETLFPHHLARTLAEPPVFRELDIDEDGRPTLLDAYLYTCRQVAQEYATNMLLATEHPLLDDTGDGRGTELQADYLTEELGGRLRAGREKPIRRVGDGALARSILLQYPPSPPSPEVEGK